MQRMRAGVTAWLLFLAITVFGTCASAYDVYVQDFNGNWPYDGWTDYNPDHGERFEWESLKSMTCEGIGAIAHTSENYAARAWVASPALGLSSTETYTCYFQQRVGNENFPEKMGTYIWKGPPRDFNPLHASAILIWKDDQVTNETCASQSKTFSVSATGQDYYVVFYCTSNADEYLAIWDDLLLRTLSAPVVSTAETTNITPATAESGGNVTSDGGAGVTARGVCWGLTLNPTLADSHTGDGTGTGVFTSNIAGLIPGTPYHVRAYAANIMGTAYGSDKSFTSGSVAPTVSTTPATHITSTTAESGGNVTSDGGAAVSARGVCWSMSANPTTAGSHTTDGAGTGVFTSNIAGLTPGVTYHVRAYATNANGTAYGRDLAFTEGSVAPTVSTAGITDITSTAAQSGGNVTSDGGATVSERGVCWSMSANPTTAGSHTTDGAGTGVFTSNIAGLTPGVTYHVRAYATNANGTAYGSDKSFTSGSVAPTVSTTPATHITSATAESGGNVTSDGGAAVSARGVCWSMSANPTTAGSHTTDGAGTGVFTSNIAGLTPGVTYHVRAYAINANGTAYGRDLAFTEGSVAPTVSTAGITDITSTAAQSGGNVTSDGGATVAARGVCWGLNPNPTLADSHTVDGDGTGEFSSSIAGLTPGETYYVRAYATNSAGTGYGEDIDFTTSGPAPTIDGFTPGSGGRETPVAIAGTGFIGVNSVRFGGTDAEGFQVDSDTRITALVGEGSSGHIMVISTRGTATSSEEFTYLPAPIPALDRWGFIGLFVLLAGLGCLCARKRHFPAS